jgi:hypothetical protein
LVSPDRAVEIYPAPWSSKGRLEAIPREGEFPGAFARDDKSSAKTNAAAPKTSLVGDDPSA